MTGDTDRVQGFLAAADGLPRDPGQTAEWLCGFDGFAIGTAENAARKAALDAQVAAWLATPAMVARDRQRRAKARTRHRFQRHPLVHSDQGRTTMSTTDTTAAAFTYRSRAEPSTGMNSG